MKTSKNLMSIVPLLLGVFILVCACSQTRRDLLPNPKINAGIGKVSGCVKNLKINDGEEIPKVVIRFPNIVTGEYVSLEAKLNEDNSFNIEMPLEINLVMISIQVQNNQSNYAGIALWLDAKKALYVEVICNEDNSLTYKTSYEMFTQNDIALINEAIDKYWSYYEGGDSLFKMKEEEFLEHELAYIDRKIEHAVEGLDLSKKALSLLTSDFRFDRMQGRILPYKDVMEMSYRHLRSENDPEQIDMPNFDRSFFKFLKDIDLNNPQYLYVYSYNGFVRSFLYMDDFAIPRIGETPVDEWLNGVKATLADLVGFDSGQFYDLLVSNSYSRQFNDELKPLSERQIANIKEYFKGGEIEKILLRKNHDVVKLDSEKSKLTVNETPAVANDKLMDAIVAKYKGKVVVVDFWATWCGPCMDAMEEMRPLKAELKDKDVVFAYITSVSSPKNRWSDIINSIGSEHYYLNAEQWASVMDKYDFEGIPSYVIYDANGELKHKFTGYPGNEQMKSRINELRPQ